MLLTIQEFLKRRPDMEVHMESAIQSAINSSFILLDGECAGLISKVQAYMENGEMIDPNNEYYRSEFELSQLIEALTSQTQYSLNLGNDYSIGGGSYSIGNINSSFNRPEGRDIVAPGVYKLLSNARVYNLNVGIGVKQDQDHYLEGTDPADKHISISKAQADFVGKYQPNAAVGNVAYVNESKMVSFSRPQDLQIGTYNTNRIAGGEGHRNNYYEIDSVPNIAFFGPNDRGTYSAIQRGEVKEILNNNYLTKEQVFRVVYASGILWNSRLNYERGWISQEVVNNVLYWYEALEDNTNKRPSQNPSIWKKLETQAIDINAIFNQIKPHIEQEITEEVEQQLLEAINNLPTIEYVEETKDQVLFFNSEQDFINFKNETNTTDRDYETLPFNATPNDYEEVRNKVNTNETNITNLQTEVNNVKANYLTTNTEQTITGLKTFRATPVGLKLQQAAGRVDKQYITFNDSNNTTTFSLGSQLTETSFEANRGNIKFQTQEAGKKVIFDTPEVEFNRAVPQFGTEIKAGFGAGLVKFLPEDNSTKTLQFYLNASDDTRQFKLLIPHPTEGNNPATKYYVDTQLQNKVSTSGNQTISGDKTFNNLVTITKTNGALAFKPGTNQPAYFEFYNGNTRIGYFGKGSSGNNNMTLGAQSGKILLEASQGVEVPQPTQPNNPATKQYVDNQINTTTTNLTNAINQVVQARDYTFETMSATPMLYGETYQYNLRIQDLQETMVVGVNVNFKDQNQSVNKSFYWSVSWATTWGPNICVKLFIDKYIYNGISNKNDINIDFSKFSVRVFYIPQYNLRTINETYKGEVFNLEEITGGK